MWWWWWWWWCIMSGEKQGMEEVGNAEEEGRKRERKLTICIPCATACLENRKKMVGGGCAEPLHTRRLLAPGLPPQPSAHNALRTKLRHLSASILDISTPISFLRCQTPADGSGAHRHTDTEASHPFLFRPCLPRCRRLVRRP